MKPPATDAMTELSLTVGQLRRLAEDNRVVVTDIDGTKKTARLIEDFLSARKNADAEHLPEMALDLTRTMESEVLQALQKPRKPSILDYRLRRQWQDTERAAGRVPECGREACNKPADPAYVNANTPLLYCRECAGMINRHNPGACQPETLPTLSPATAAFLSMGAAMGVDVGGMFDRIGGKPRPPRVVNEAERDAKRAKRAERLARRVRR